MDSRFVGHQPLAESPMRNHPLTPMRDSNLTRLFVLQLGEEPGLIDHPLVMRGVTRGIGKRPASCSGTMPCRKRTLSPWLTAAAISLIAGGSAFGAAVTVALARKSGNFGAEDFFHRARAMPEVPP